MLPNNDKPAFRQVLGDDSTRGLDLALTPVVFGAMGWLVDRWLGTAPVFAIVLAVIATLSTVAKMYYQYEAEMQGHESTGRWNRANSVEGAETPDADLDLWSVREGSDG